MVEIPKVVRSIRNSYTLFNRGNLARALVMGVEGFRDFHRLSPENRPAVMESLANNSVDFSGFRTWINEQLSIVPQRHIDEMFAPIYQSYFTHLSVTVNDAHVGDDGYNHPMSQDRYFTECEGEANVAARYLIGSHNGMPAIVPKELNRIFFRNRYNMFSFIFDMSLAEAKANQDKQVSITPTDELIPESNPEDIEMLTRRLDAHILSGLESQPPDFNHSEFAAHATPISNICLAMTDMKLFSEKELIQRARKIESGDSGSCYSTLAQKSLISRPKGPGKVVLDPFVYFTWGTMAIQYTGKAVEETNVSEGPESGIVIPINDVTITNDGFNSKEYGSGEYHSEYPINLSRSVFLVQSDYASFIKKGLADLGQKPKEIDSYLAHCLFFDPSLSIRAVFFLLIDTPHGRQLLSTKLDEIASLT